MRSNMSINVLTDSWSIIFLFHINEDLAPDTAILRLIGGFEWFSN